METRENFNAEPGTYYGNQDYGQQYNQLAVHTNENSPM